MGEAMVRARTDDRVLVCHAARPMLGCSRGSTLQVYPLGAFEDAAGGAETVPLDTAGRARAGR
jgi:hypothetical protein